MSKAAKTTDIGRVVLPGAAEGDVLHFLTRTLQAHFLEAEPQDVLAKLQNLKGALDQQEVTLLDWPDSASKDRICEALAKAKILVGQIVDEFATTAEKHSPAAAPKPFDAIASSFQRSFKP
jgi:hypothetical protein